MEKALKDTLLELANTLVDIVKKDDVEKATCASSPKEDKQREDNEKFEWFLSQLTYENSHNSDKLDGTNPIYVYWSGGFDSTALVLALWRKYRTTIHTISIVHKWVPTSKRDKAARTRLMKIFAERGIKIENTEINVDRHGVCDGRGLGQPGVWLSQLGNIASSNINVCFGYVRGDDIWHYIKSFRKVWEGFNEIREAKNSSLCFPIEFVDKLDILRYIKQEGLDKICNYCERDDDDYLGEAEPCGTCHSCTVHNIAIKELEKLEEKENAEKDKSN